MKKTSISILSIAIAALLSSPILAQQKNNQPKLNNAHDSLSYAIGLDLGENLENANLGDINLQMMVQGIQQQFDKSATFNIEQARHYIQTELQRKAEAMAEMEKGVGKKFLEENKKKPGVQTTASGLQYKVITEGKGIKPNASDTVEVHYHGTLIDGTVFDSSVERGETIMFALNQVIPGWTEGVQLMPAGSKYVFYIPENLAYGAQAMGTIKPYSTLIFEVELFSVKQTK